MAIRLLALDLDGTLLNSRSEISPANRDALAAARTRGIEVVIVTGRRFYSARRVLAALPFPVTLIASNGAVMGSTDGEIFYRDFLPRRVALQVLETAEAYRPFTVAIFDRPGRGQVVMQEGAAPDGPLNWYLTNNPDHLLQVPDLPAAVQEDPIQIMFGGPPGRLEPLEPILRASPVARQIHLTWTKYLTRNLSIFDVMRAGCSKGKALGLLAEQREVAREAIMAIGDNFNDREMLEFAGWPVVMGNRPSDFEHPDDWPTTASNDEDGVAHAVAQMFAHSGTRAKS